MITPFDAIRSGLVKAYLQIVRPELPDDQAIVPVKFNPTQYQIQKANTFADINIPGLETPPIQFIRGSGEKLTVELLVDTSDTVEDVREKYVDRLRGLMNINCELHAPPIVRFIWERDLFTGVLDSLTTTYIMFRPDGVPLRAKLGVSLKEYREVDDQIRESPTCSPDFEKSYTVLSTDSLSGIAEKVYRDPSAWRAIADSNGIRDPRTLEPGRILVLPKLR
jgi:nucleoid-associated protein YgaU